MPCGYKCKNKPLSDVQSVKAVLQSREVFSIQRFVKRSEKKVTPMISLLCNDINKDACGTKTVRACVAGIKNSSARILPFPCSFNACHKGYNC